MFLNKNENKKDLKGCIMGAIMGDALGVPFEFKNKSEIGKVKLKTVDKWSDDTSMILCTMESLTELKNYSTKDIADKYIKWLYNGHWTPQGIVFDCGKTTANALRLYRQKSILTGINEEDACGNGSLMRIMPLLFYVHKNKENRFNVIKEFSSITHSHIRCIIGCAIYTEIALNLLDGMDKVTAYNKMKEVILEEYKDYEDELQLYSRILYNDISKYDIDTFVGTGYVLHTLECVLHGFLNSKNYKDSIIRAISFGEDTDTVACITGGLSGLYYGYNNIPKKYINKLSRKDDILKLLEEFNDVYK